MRKMRTSQVSLSIVRVLAAAIAGFFIFSTPCYAAFSWPKLNKAQFISQSVPNDIIAGEKYAVRITFKNNGLLPWTMVRRYYLSSQNPANNLTWSTARVNLDRRDVITLGKSKTFTFIITAPETPGVYNFQWQMYQEGTGFFGEKSQNLSINVYPKLSLPPIEDKSTYEDKLLQFNISVQGPPNISVAAANLPQGASFDPQSRTFKWKPQHGQAGVYPIHFEASDGLNTVSQDMTTTVLKTVVFGNIYEKDQNNQNIGLESATVQLFKVDYTKPDFLGELLGTALTDSTGHFDIHKESWPDGNYFIKVSKQGYKSYRAFARIWGNVMMPFSVALFPLDENDFVVTSGNRLMLQKNRKPFYFSLANQYYLFYKPLPMVDEVFADATKAMGINVIRTWGFCDGMYKEGASFQPDKRVYHPSGFARMDYLIKKAYDNGMRLIIPLVNHWKDFGGMDEYVKWAGGISRDDFYTNEECKNIYKAYVNYFLNRANPLRDNIKYKDDPTILIWELANEPRSGDSTGDIVYNWADEMSTFIKEEVGANQLVSTGEEGWYIKEGYTNNGTDFIRNSQLPNIDVSSFHLLMNNMGFSELQASQWVSEHIDDAHFTVGKPVYCGEMGRQVYRTDPDVETQMETRNRLYADWYGIFLDRVADGGGFWLLSAHNYEDWDNYTVHSPDTEYPGYEHPLDVGTNDVISNFSAKIAERRNLGYYLPIMLSPGGKTVNEGEALEFQVIFSNPSNRTVSFSATNLPEGATFDNSGYFSWPAAEAGLYKDIELKLTSGTYVNAARINISVTDTNGDNTPHFHDFPNPILMDKNTSLDNAVDIWNYVIDDEPVQNITFSAYCTDPAVHVSVDNNRYIDITPDPDHISYASIYVTAIDQKGLKGEINTVIIVRANNVIRVPADYPAIQEAISNSFYGDTILVSPGTYYEGVILPTASSLISEAGPENTVIDAIGQPAGVSGSDAVTVKGFTIKNASGPGIRGVDNIINNIIEHNEAQGIFAMYEGETLIENNIIRFNNSTDYGGGIRLTAVGAARIINNVIHDNTGHDGGGIYLSDSPGENFLVANNIIINNVVPYYGGGIRTWVYGGTPQIVYNDVWNNYPTNYYSPQGEGSISLDPRFVDIGAGDYHLQAGSPCINTGNPDPQYNDEDGSRNDMGVYGGPNSL